MATGNHFPASTGENFNIADEDDWFFDTIRRYKNLYMYDLQYPVTAMCWIQNKYLCVATKGRPGQHELTTLALPETFWNSTLSKDRDFRVTAGGFSLNLISDIRHIPDTRYICTSPDNGSCSLQIWSLSTEDTDVMQNENEIPNRKSKSLPAKMAINDDQVIFGSHTDNLCLTDTSTFQIIHDSSSLNVSNRLSHISWHQSSTLCCCQEDGDIQMFDIRHKLFNISDNFKCGTQGSLHWTMDIKDNTIALLSSEGDLVIRDMRNSYKSIITKNIGLTTQSDYNLLTVKISHEENESYSISGFDGNVYIYSSGKENGKESELYQLDFVHEGHHQSTTQTYPVKTVTHLLHPSLSDLYLSAATNGSLHAWQKN